MIINENNTYEVEKVYKGESYYIDLLTSKAISRFVWCGLPSTIPSYELERLLVQSPTQKAVIVEKNGKHYIQPFSGVGVGVYEDAEPTTLFANPIIGSGMIDTNLLDIENSPIVFENYNNYNLWNTIRRYAKKLSQYDSSLDITTVNTRNMSTPIAKTSSAKASLEVLFKKLREGFYSVLQSSAKDGFLEEDTYKYLPTVSNSYFKDMTELAQLRNNELRMFLFEIGQILPKDKMEAVLSDESQNDKMIPLINLDSSLQARKDACERLNNLYGWNVSVDLTPIYKKVYKDFLVNENDVEMEGSEENETL